MGRKLTAGPGRLDLRVAVLIALATAACVLIASVDADGRKRSRRANAPVRLVAVGDIACSPSAPVTATKCRHADVAQLVSNLRPRALVLPGDIQYDNGELASFKASFDRAFGSLGVRMLPAPGNHEYRTQGAAGYYDYFGDRAGPDRRGWYSLDIGAWHVVSLNTNCDVVDCGRDAPQTRWLRADLERSRAQCTLALWHHPLVSSGVHGDNPVTGALWHELDRAGVELLIAGHDHHYERFAQLGANGQPKSGGVREFVVGTGGKSLYPTGEPRPGSIYRVSQFGALALDLGDGRYGWRFVSTSGDTLDSGRVSCR